MAAITPSIILDSPDAVYVGGGTITGRVKVVVAGDVDTAELVLFLRCQGTSKAQRIEKTVDSVREKTKLFAGEWRPGEYLYPFAITVPFDPRTYQGRIFDVTWHLGTGVRSTAGDDVVVESEVTILTKNKSTGGGEEIKPEMVIHCEAAKNVTGCLVAAALFAGLGMLLVWRSFSVPREAAELYGLGGLAVTAVGGIGIFLLTYIALINKRIKAYEVRLGSKLARPGDTIPFTLMFEPDIPFEIESVDVIVRASEVLDFFKSSKQKHLKETVYQNRQQLPLASRQVRKHMPVQVTGEITIPPEGPCSIDLMLSGEGMQLCWEIEFTLAMKKWPDWIHFEDIIVAP